ncbi:O-glucosyltransferase rumi [Dorcoceras hygrometricum]|uniref:O-glucosyltransferase rumi n=1 Tax=Dorcoceras hygrometricum TaxID=472368 RepID=A0A2Z7CIS4_9LAMI|nr:O-glucosyltransferase rumi [Dorcoceras hygrometricum]
MGFFCSEVSHLVRVMDAVIRRPLTKTWLTVVFLLVLALGLFICSRDYIDSSIFIAGNSRQINNLETPRSSDSAPRTLQYYYFPLNCSLGNLSRTCPAVSTKFLPENNKSSPTPPAVCPDHFRWIYEDLWPWRETGINKEMVMNARPMSHFRLVILQGRVYVEKYKEVFQSRDVFTIWGILQLLRRYPGKVPDLELMFDCSDRPSIRKALINNPALFRYCGDDSSVEILFPDWSFWGWPEINIKPWETLSKDIADGNKRRSWMEKEPYAYWKGNPTVNPRRKDLLRCNVSPGQEWNARVYAHDWKREERQGFKHSDLSTQCTHRYKVYVEGVGWSVSEKYIIACDSMTLLVQPQYHDFFSRGLIPLQHYWPIKDHDMCPSIKFAVDWGNTHQQQAEAIGKAGSSFIQQDLKMDYVYDYMFHVLNQYAKLLKYKPTAPEGASEICFESIACPAEGFRKKCLDESMVGGLVDSSPCTMAPPYDPATFRSFLRNKDEAMMKVETLEKEYRERNNSGKS